jgi:hypothetical protein
MIAAEQATARSRACSARVWRPRVIGAALGALVLASLPSIARADDAGARNLAEQLFSDGKKLMEEGSFDEACPKLAESQRLDPGGGTILNLALCHEGQGHFAAAWSEFRQALALARTDGRRDREQFALEHLALVEPKVSRLTFAVRPPARVPGLTIKLDGEVVGQAAWSSQLPVDPGAHDVVASAPGKLDRRVTVQVTGIADTKTVTILPLDDAPAESSEASGLGSTPDTAASEARYGRRTAGFIVGGLGLAALGVGSGFGVQALRKRSDSDASCSGSNCRTQSGVDLNDDAKRFAIYADVGIGVGIVALAAGTYLVLSSGAPSRVRAATAVRTKVSPLVGMGTSGFAISGFW